MKNRKLLLSKENLEISMQTPAECPRCGETEQIITEECATFDRELVEHLSCMKCKTHWYNYYIPRQIVVCSGKDEASLGYNEKAITDMMEKETPVYLRYKV